MSTNLIIIFLCLSIIIAIIGVIVSIYLSKVSKKKATISPLIAMTAGIFLAAIALFLPIYLIKYFDEKISLITVYKSFLLSIHNSMRLFVLDGEFDIIKDFLASVNISSTL